MKWRQLGATNSRQTLWSETIDEIGRDFDDIEMIDDRIRTPSLTLGEIEDSDAQTRGGHVIDRHENRPRRSRRPNRDAEDNQGKRPLFRLAGDRGKETYRVGVSRDRRTVMMTEGNDNDDDHERGPVGDNRADIIGERRKQCGNSIENDGKEVIKTHREHRL